MESNKSENAWQTLKNKWVNFLGIILTPSVLIVLMVTIVLIWLSPVGEMGQNFQNLSNILTVIISIFAGIVGALISRKWSELNDGSILITRGKSAIRGLKLLLLNLKSLEQRVKIHLSRLIEEETYSELNKNNFEEIIEKCNSLQEEAMNAVEEWQDIIPEANIKTQIGFISGLKKEKEILNVQINDLKKELNSTKSNSKEESKELTKELKEKESELEEVKLKLREKERELSGSLFSGLSSPSLTGELPSGSADFLVTESTYKCNSCQEEFTKKNSLGDIEPSLIKPSCPNCGSKNVSNILFR